MDQETRRVEMDQLESRVLLAAPAPGLTDGGLLSVRATDEADSINIVIDARRRSKINVQIDGVGYKFPIASVTSIKVKTGGGDDSIIVSEANGVITTPVVLLGGEGNDTMIGGSGNDVLIGHFGNDSASGNAGNDSVTGDDGADTLAGGVGNDTVQGGNENDTLTDTSGTNGLDGGPGTDIINGVSDVTTPVTPGGADLQIKLKSETAYSGDNIYNATGASQAKSFSVGFYGYQYHLRIQNDSSITDSFLITATPGDADHWRVRFYDSQTGGYTGGTNVTDAVTIKGGWNTGALAPGAYKDFRMEILGLYNALGGDAKDVFITATSRNNAAKADTVKTTSTNVTARQVEIRRQNFDSSGEYLMTVQNMGNVFDSVKLSAPKSGAGFVAQYFDAQTGGNDITNAIAAGTWQSPAMAPGESIPLRVEIASTDSNEHSVTLTAKSTGDTTRTDSAVISNRGSGVVEPSVFVIGAWSQPFNTFAKWKSRGVNTMVQYESYAATVEEWSQYAVDAGLYQIRRPVTVAANDIGLTSLLAWGHPDEPEITTKHPASEIQANYAKWKSIDPTRPVWVNFAGGYVNHWQGNINQADYAPFLAGTDWVSQSIYPVTGWDRPNDLDAAGKALDRLEKWSGGKPQYAVIESGDQELAWAPPEIPGPTTGQFRAEIWDSIIRGARGIIYFPQKFKPAFSYDNTPPEIVDEMQIQHSRIKAIEGALLAPIDPSSLGFEASAPLEASWRIHNGKYYFIVLNMSSKEVTRTMSLKGIGKASSADVSGEGRNVAISNGSFTDTFGAYETHVYVVG